MAINNNELIKTTLKLEKIIEEIEGNCYFLEEEENKWGNYISFDELKKGKEDERKYSGIKYEVKWHKEGCEKERKARESYFPVVCRNVKSAENFLKKVEELGYNKIPRFKKLYNRLGIYVRKIKNRKPLKLEKVGHGGTGTP